MTDRKRMVFICSPLKNGDCIRNIENAKKYCRYVTLTEKNTVVFAPHLFFTQFLDDRNELERNLGICGGFEFLKMCDDVYVFKTYGTVSNGMMQEIELAKLYGKKVSEFDETACQEILDRNG